MTEIIQPSPELLGLLADLCQFKIPADTIHKVDTSDIIDVSKVTWPLQQDALLRKALEKAVEESKMKILQEAAKSKQWRAEVVILRKGSLVPFPGEICLIIPLVQSSGRAEKVNFHFIKDKPGPPEAWGKQLYILKPGTCIRVMEGELRMIAVLCT